MNEDITINRLRELKGDLTQEEFATKIHSTQSTVSKIFSGTPVSSANLIAIAKAFNVSTDWILGLSDQKTEVHTISTSNLTYAEVIAVLDELYNRKTISVGYQFYGNDEVRDTKLIRVNDQVLSYLINARDKISDAGREVVHFWRNTVASDFNNVKILNWNNSVTELCKEGTIESNKAAVGFIKMAEDICEDQLLKQRR